MSDPSRKWQPRQTLPSAPVTVITVDMRQADPERYVPPHPRGVMQMLRERGHTVTVRCDRNGSMRYRVDGGREVTALQMTRRLERIEKGKAELAK